ncbi:hypothetical protein SDC9_167280 [bioreactor metagenome]|uniref:Uncharacterized protein n=1 Tax=bioreactor metagenome TaxID=1076179 RepID=A0A645FZT5_9ZZZZ
MLIVDCRTVSIHKKTFKSLFLKIQPVDPQVSGNPLYAFFFFQYIPDNIITDTLRISGIWFEHFEFPSVIHVQTIPGTKPHQSVRILGYGIDGTVRESVVVGQIDEIIGFCYDGNYRKNKDNKRPVLLHLRSRSLYLHANIMFFKRKVFVAGILFQQYSI